MVQWLGLGAITDTAHGPGSIPGRGTKIPQALLVQPKKKNQKKKNKTQKNLTWNAE